MKQRYRVQLMSEMGVSDKRAKKRLSYLHRKAKIKAEELSVNYRTKIDQLRTKHDTENRNIPMSKRDINRQVQPEVS